jgi:hypothetical protein
MLMHLHHTVQDIIREELTFLEDNSAYDLDPQRRMDIYRALGPLSVTDKQAWFAHIKAKAPPHLTSADRVRLRIAMLTAHKVVPLWQTACQETEANFTEHEDPEEIQRQEQEYLVQRRQTAIEHISVYDVPRAFTATHIMEMAGRMFSGEVLDYVAFASEANEWWQIYPRPEGMEREYCIKWACQEYLYETLGWSQHFQDLRVYDTDDPEVVAYDHTEAPAGYAVLAYAGVFQGATPGFDDDKRRAFWRWWLAEAIPFAWRLEHETSGR